MKSEIQLLRVEFVPKTLEAGILYASERFKVAAHICPCGCGTKIITPLGICEWSFSEKWGKPTLYPSIGNWQIPCKSHYWITDGQIEWSYLWTEEKIEAGRRKEQAIRESYYQKKNQFRRESFWKRIKNWICENINSETP